MTVSHLYQMTPGTAQVSNGAVVLIAHNNETSIAGSQLLYDAVHLGMHPVPCGNHNDGHVLIHQRQGTMLHLSSQNTFTVHQSHLFDLQDDAHRFAQDFEMQ